MAFMLEEVEVPVKLGHGVVHWMLSAMPGTAKRLLAMKSTQVVRLFMAALYPRP